MAVEILSQGDEQQEELPEGEAAGTEHVAEVKEEVPAEQAAEGAPAAVEQSADPEEVVVTVGDEKPPEEERAPAWVKQVRLDNREKARRIRELEAQLSQKNAPPELGKEPELAEFDYDEFKFKAALREWNHKKRAADEAAEKAEQQAQAAKSAWDARLAAYETLKTQLKVKDYDDAEAVVQEALTPTQAAIIVKGAKNPAVLIYALGKNPGKRQEIAAITDPVEFAFAVATLEAQLKVTKRTPPPAPERRITGGAAVAGAIDSALDRLREEASKTGDYSKVVAYKRSKKAA